MHVDPFLVMPSIILVFDYTLIERWVSMLVMPACEHAHCMCNNLMCLHVIELPKRKKEMAVAS